MHKTGKILIIMATVAINQTAIAQTGRADFIETDINASSMEWVDASLKSFLNVGTKWSTNADAEFSDYSEVTDADKDSFQDAPKTRNILFSNTWSRVDESNDFNVGVEFRNGNLDGGQLPKLKYQVFDNPYRYAQDAWTLKAFANDRIARKNNSIISLDFAAQTGNSDTKAGHRLYNYDMINVEASALYESKPWTEGEDGGWRAGVGINSERYDTEFRLDPTGLETEITEQTLQETTASATGEYRYKPDNKKVTYVSLKACYSTEYDFFLTPEARFEYAPAEGAKVTLFASNTKKTMRPMVENNVALSTQEKGLYLASSRLILLDRKLEQESYWDFGMNGIITRPESDFMLQLGYTYRYYKNHTITDFDTDAHSIHFTASHGKSYFHRVNVNAVVPLFTNLSMKASYIYEDARETLTNDKLTEVPFVPRHNAGIEMSYSLMGKWQLKASYNYLAGIRTPEASNIEPLWESTTYSYDLLSVRLEKTFRDRFKLYAGGCNMTDSKQKNAVIKPLDTWGDSFDSSMIYMPLRGARYYAGFRIKLQR